MFSVFKIVRRSGSSGCVSEHGSNEFVAGVDHSRRSFVQGGASALALSALPLSGRLLAGPGKMSPGVLSGNSFNLDIDHMPVNFTGRPGMATTVNQGLPGPTLRWKEGERVTLRVTNHLSGLSSIHWHGIILPAEMDGVPGLSFAGIPPGDSFEYSFDVVQSGTYWYHSHSDFQEQTGLYGAIIIDPKEPDPVLCDREYVVMLSDWTDESPQGVYEKLKTMGHYYNFNQRTVGDMWRDVREKGLLQSWRDRGMWNRMRMSDSDLADVTGHTYTFLMNGMTPEEGWTGIFLPGEKVRLRFINAAAMTVFDVRIPGLKMKVVAADGQNVQPVTVDEFRISVAETYDVIVEPLEDTAVTVFAQSSDRSGYARGTLTSSASAKAVVPAMDAVPVLGHQDMGMGAVHDGHDMAAMSPMQLDHSAHGGEQMNHSHHQMHSMEHAHHPGASSALGRAGMGSNFQAGSEIRHQDSEFGPGVDMHSASPQSGLHDPGLGLRHHAHLHGRRVLCYADLRNLYPTLDRREPSREIQLHLTGNMKRYMWSIDGIAFSDAEPLEFEYGERLRIVLVNDTMMAHPVHLHGMWSELETGDPEYIPRKHTIIVQPGSTISYLVTADAPGRWAFHCHMLYHMPGMMREVHVSGGAI